MRYLLILGFYLSNCQMMAQSSGQELLDKVVNQFNKVNDYSATVVVKADVPMIKVLPVKAKIYYKR